MKVFVGGSLNDMERIKKVIKARPTYFAVAAPILNRTLAPGGGISDQIKAIIDLEKKIIE
ncbi:MAG: hypothetical protein QXJ17_00585 [Nitrososphaeria archaeon]